MRFIDWFAENKQEEWKDIKGFEGQYKISNMGRVWSVSRTVRIGGYKWERVGDDNGSK